MTGIQVLIVDPHELAREGLRLLLAGEDYEVIGATASLGAALRAIEGGGRPDLLVLVLADCGETVESAALHRIRAVLPDCKLVLIVNAVAPALLARMTDWRVNALLRGDMSREVLIRSLHLVMLGQDIFPAASAPPPGRPDDNAGDAA